MKKGDIEKIKKDMNVLDPEFKKQLEEMLGKVNASISMLYEAATHDRKTKVYNYSFFRTVFEMEFEKAKRGLQSLSLLIVDIDFFKKINDVHGHIQADKMLEKLAQILKTAVRNSDLVARFGGEEFVILFPETNLNRAIKVCKRINKKIKEDKFLKKYKLTISGGLTEYKQRDNIKKMQERADKALYEAKKTGRNRIIAYGKTKRRICLS